MEIRRLGRLTEGATPPGSALQRVAPPELGRPTPQAPEPVDRADVQASKTSPDKPKKSFLRRAFRAAGYTGLIVAGGASVLGGIAVMGNREALSAPLAVEIYDDAELFEAPGLADWDKPDQATGGPVHSRPTRRPSRPEGVTVIVPPDTLRSFVDDLQDSPQTRQFLEGKIASTKQKLAEKLQELNIPDQQVLLDLEVPLPTGDQALLHLGNLNLPSGGLQSLRTERLPVTLETRTARVNPNLQFDIQPIEVGQPVRPDGLGEQGVFLGACRARFHLPKQGVAISGEAELKLDLSGHTTRAKREALLTRLDQTRDQATRRGLEDVLRKLDRRLSNSARLREATSEQGLRGLLEDGFQDQRAQFEAHVKVGEGPLAEVVYHLWLAPDHTGDGRADILVAQQSSLDALSELDIDLTKLDIKGQDPDGKMGRLLNQTVESHFRRGIQSSIPQATEVIRQLAGRRLGEEFSQGVAFVQNTANGKLEALYQQGERIDIPTGTKLAPELLLTLGGVDIDSTGRVAVGFHPSSRSAGLLQTDLPAGMKLDSGEFAVRISGHELNRQLRDRSQGGAVDWDATLEQARETADLRELRFGEDEAGRTVYPQLTFQNGRPALEFDLVARLKGAKPVEGTTGLLKGATGALDKGAADVQKTLSKEAGLPGDILGTVVRAPTFLVDKIVEGGKAVVDNTVGAVVDPVPEAITRPTVHTRVTIPLNMAVENGSLQVAPDAEGVRFSSPQEKLPFDPLELLPTRLISNLIVNLVAELDGPARIGQEVEAQTVGVQLGAYGVRFEQLAPVGGGSDRAPDVVVKMGLQKDAAFQVAENFLPPNR